LRLQPGEAFGKAQHRECAEDLKRQRMMLAKTEKLEEESGKKGEPPLTKGEKGYHKMKGHTVARDEMKALMAEGQADDLLAWKVADSGFDISSRTDFFLTPFDEAPLVGNNPFGGKRVTKGVTVNGLIGQLPKEKGESSSEEKEKVKAEALEEVSNPHQSSPHPHLILTSPHLILTSSCHSRASTSMTRRSSQSSVIRTRICWGSSWWRRLGVKVSNPHLILT